MFEDTLELAENKLLLIYILEKINVSISKNKLTEIVLENNLINYFTLQEYINELISSNFLECTEFDKKHRLKLTSKGHKVLKMFKNRISYDKIKIIDSYIQKNISTIKNEISLTADYTIAENNSFTVNLCAYEKDITLIDLKINVSTNKSAKSICEKWKANSTQLYNDILKMLTNS